MVDTSCPRHSELEDWNHVIKCICVEDRRNDNLRKIISKLEKSDETNAEQEKINVIVSDIRKNVNSEKIETNQQLLSMRFFPWDID